MVPLAGANGMSPPVGIRRPQIKMKEEVVVMSQSFQQLMEESERKKKGRQDRNRDTANRSRKKKQDYTQVLEVEVNRLTKIKETLAKHKWGGAGSTSACSKSGTSDDIKNAEGKKSVTMKAPNDGRDADGAYISEKNSSTQKTKEGGDSISTSSTLLSLELTSILLGDRGGNVGQSTVAQDANDLQVLAYSPSICFCSFSSPNYMSFVWWSKKRQKARTANWPYFSSVESKRNRLDHHWRHLLSCESETRQGLRDITCLLIASIEKLA
jgi:hypothetical protein